MVSLDEYSSLVTTDLKGLRDRQWVQVCSTEGDDISFWRSYMEFNNSNESFPRRETTQERISVRSEEDASKCTGENWSYRTLAKRLGIKKMPSLHFNIKCILPARLEIITLTLLIEIFSCKSCVQGSTLTAAASSTRGTQKKEENCIPSQGFYDRCGKCQSWRQYR